MNNERLWTKDFVLICVVTFFLMFAMFLLLVTMAPYTTANFDASTSTAGLVASIFILGALIGRLAAGRTIAKVGSKKILMAGLILYIAMTFLYFVAYSLPLLLTVRVLHGLGVGIATTATGTMIAQIIPPRRSGEGISYFSMSIVLSQAIGPLVGILLSQHIGFNTVFTLSLLLGAVSLAISFAIQVPDIKQKKEEEEKGFKLSHFIEYRALPISLCMSLVAFSYSSILSFLTVYAQEINLVEAASFYFLVYAMIVLMTRPFSGRLMDRKGANIIIYPVLLIFASGMFVLSQASHGITLLLAGAIIGLGYGNFQPITQAIAMKVTPKHRLGLANSTYFIFLDLGLGVGPFLIGFLVPFTGYRGLYFSMVFIILISIGVYYLLHGRKDRELHRNKEATAI